MRWRAARSPASGRTHPEAGSAQVAGLGQGSDGKWSTVETQCVTAGSTGGFGNDSQFRR